MDPETKQATAKNILKMLPALGSIVSREDYEQMPSSIGPDEFGVRSLHIPLDRNCMEELDRRNALKYAIDYNLFRRDAIYLVILDITYKNEFVTNCTTTFFVEGHPENLTNTKTQTPSLSEKEILSKMDDMCSESLSPEMYDKWEEVKLQLQKTRQKLKSIPQN